MQNYVKEKTYTLVSGYVRMFRNTHIWCVCVCMCTCKYIHIRKEVCGSEHTRSSRCCMPLYTLETCFFVFRNHTNITHSAQIQFFGMTSCERALCHHTRSAGAGVIPVIMHRSARTHTDPHTYRHTTQHHTQHTCTYMRAHACMHTRRYTQMHMCTHTHTHTQMD